jgi:hypothetical protein
MLLISDELRQSLIAQNRIVYAGGSESLVGLTFEESVFFLCFCELEAQRNIADGPSARHFNELNARHLLAIARIESEKEQAICIYQAS